MATQGFASGFNQGFGLVNDVFKRRAQDEYNRERLALAERERLDAADYRNRMAGIQETQAKTAAENLGLKRDQFEAEQKLIDPETGLNPLQTQQLNESKARQELAVLGKENEVIRQQTLRAEQDAQNESIKRQQGAIAVNDLYLKITNRLQQGLPIGDMFDAEIEDVLKKTEGTGVFDIGNMLRYYQEQGSEEISGMVQELKQSAELAAQGVKPPDFDLTPQRAAAIESALSLNKSAAVGKTIDQSFTNAPEWMRNGDWKVESLGLDSITMDKNNKLNGQLWVVATNAEGERVPYLAPLTEKRKPYQKTALNLDFDDAMQVAAGYQFTARAMMPALEVPIKEYVQNQKYKGVKEFDAAVDARMNALQEQINAGGTLTGGVVLPGEDRNQVFSDPATRAKVRQRIERQMMFGENPTNRLDIGEWFEAERKSLAMAEPPRFINPNANPRAQMNNKSSARTLGELLPILNDPNADPVQVRRLVANLSGYYGANGEIKDANALKKFLEDKGYL